MFDIIIIGSGPGGYVAAIRAAQLGMKTAIVEREHLGGICLNWGCIPTKALLRSADIFHIAERGSEFGLSLTASKDQNINPIVERSRKIARQLNGGVAYLLKKNAITLIAGEASLLGGGKVLVRKPTNMPPRPQFPLPKDAKGEGIYEAKHIIIATGARPRVIPGLEPDSHLVWTYYDAMIPKQMPKSLLVLGSGAIGIEFASFYRAMGADVTLVEAQNRMMPAEDIEISALVRKQFERRGIRVLTSSTIAGIEKADGGLTANIQTQDGARAIISADRLITAVGTIANIEGLGLDTANVKMRDSFIAVDAYGRTNVAGLYAIGDVAGPPMLAHKAEHEGVICVEAIAGLTPHGLDKAAIPACTYGEPQVASIGLTQENAEKQGFKVTIGRFPFAANGKAIASGESDGLIKTLFDADTGKLIGAHMVGAEVSELIQGFAIAMACGATIKELTTAVFPHPTLSEIMHESCLQAAGRALHI